MILAARLQCTQVQPGGVVVNGSAVFGNIAAFECDDGFFVEFGLKILPPVSLLINGQAHRAATCSVCVAVAVGNTIDQLRGAGTVPRHIQGNDGNAVADTDAVFHVAFTNKNLVVNGLIERDLSTFYVQHITNTGWGNGNLYPMDFLAGFNGVNDRILEQCDRIAARCVDGVYGLSANHCRIVNSDEIHHGSELRRMVLSIIEVDTESGLSAGNRRVAAGRLVSNGSQHLLCFNLGDTRQEGDGQFTIGINRDIGDGFIPCPDLAILCQAQATVRRKPKLIAHLCAAGAFNHQRGTLIAALIVDGGRQRTARKQCDGIASFRKGFAGGNEIENNEPFWCTVIQGSREV